VGAKQMLLVHAWARANAALARQKALDATEHHGFGSVGGPWL